MKIHIPADGSREAYEAAVIAAGLEPLSDQCIIGYGMTHGDFGYQTPQRAHQQMSRPRREHLNAEAAAALASRNDELIKLAASAPPVGGSIKRCAVCHRALHTGEAMVASLGYACADHYDDLSD